MAQNRRLWHLAMLMMVCVIGMSLLLAQEPARQGDPEEPAPTRKEAESGILFPIWLDHDEVGRHQLLGLGCREKTIFAVNVYGMAMYADAEGLGKKLHGHIDTVEAKKVHKDQKTINLILEGDFALSMRWVFCRDVDAEDVREAFEDWLGPRRKEAVARIVKVEERKAADEASLKAMQDFRDIFDADLDKVTS